MADQCVYKTLRLHTSADKFFIEPRDPKALGEKILEIDRVTQELNLADNEGQIPPSAEAKDIFGIMGIIHLLAGPYLIVITRKRLVGYIQGNEIWKVLGTEVLPFPRALLHLTEDQAYYDKIYLSMVTSVLQTDGFYFSCSYDLTHTIQRLSGTSPDFVQMPLFERADPRFVWNNHLLRPFTVQPELHQFILPVMHGFINITTCSINKQSFDFILISRRSCYRAGVRYYIRGLDDEGRSANYVETEQIIQYSNGTSSFVQIRGSIPLYWSQRPNLKYKPTPSINSTANHVYCSANYYGERCTKYCRRSNSHLGHYYCDNHGNKRCYSSWYGDKCNKQCVERNDDVNGHFRCDSSGNRFCRSGWYGDKCNKHCISHDDDKNGHYVCDSHGNKICRTNWHGEACKQFCRRNSTSTFICDKQGNKVCYDKWFGPSCTKYCSPGSRVSCDEKGNKVCLPGWYGDYCQRQCVASDDDENGHYNCTNNGTKVCLPGWKSPDCKYCKKGFVPPNCHRQCEPQSNQQDGYFTCDKNNNKQCLMWWYGKSCKSYCVPHSDPINGHYTCDSIGKKQCTMGWHGSNCTNPCSQSANISECKEFERICATEVSLSSCNQCPPGFYGKNCSFPCVERENLDSTNILCNMNGKQTCGKWWSGKKCERYCVPHDDDFNGHYICDMNGKKRCLLGWTSPDCKQPYSVFDIPQ